MNNIHYICYLFIYFVHKIKVTALNSTFKIFKLNNILINSNTIMSICISSHAVKKKKSDLVF